MPPTLTRVVRLDSFPVATTYYTEEGYLKDRPILTSTGIFEYRNPDGSIRRELRLPEEVFAEESLKSYKGKPIIITHDAGLVTKDNVGKHQIGTILTDGYRSGDDVRGEIIIHDTDKMKRCRLKELSLGYDLDLEETSGEWNGQPYDAIQRNIRINHLALVREARAGDQARLNIDSRDSNTILKGGKAMSKKTTKDARRADGVLTKEELAKAIDEYMARRAASAEANGDEGTPDDGKVVSTEPEVNAADTGAENEPAVEEAASVEEKVQMIKDRNNGDNEPATVEEATEVLAKKDEDMNLLYDIIDTLLAERDFGAKADGCGTEGAENTDGDDENAEGNTDEEGGEEGKPAEGATEEGEKTDSDEEEEKKPEIVMPEVKSTSQMNADAVDAIVRQRIQLGMLGRIINLDGLENMSITDAKKAIVLAHRPSVRLDGKSETYVNAMFDLAVADINAGSKKDTSFQRKQMFNKDSRADESDSDSAEAARARMIAKQSR